MAGSLTRQPAQAAALLATVTGQDLERTRRGVPDRPAGGAGPRPVHRTTGVSPRVCRSAPARLAPSAGFGGTGWGRIQSWRVACGSCRDWRCCALAGWSAREIRRCPGLSATARAPRSFRSALSSGTCWRAGTARRRAARTLFGLLRWFRFLAAVDVAWDRAQRGEVRDFVLWLRTAGNPARDRRRRGGPAPGSLNARTGKPYLREGYAPATLNHAVAVLSAYYAFHLETGLGPVMCPVPPQARGGRRVHAHHNPLEPFALHRRGALQQRRPLREPRALPDDVVDALFAGIGCNRDRALFSMFLASGARAGELLAMTVGDVRPGDGRIYVMSKGLGGVKEGRRAFR